MKLSTLLAVLVLATAAAAFVSNAEAGNRRAIRQTQYYPWHGAYYDPAWGVPHALVVPPTADYQTNWGWGVTNTRVEPIAYQFGRTYPGYVGFGYGFRPTPPWPSDTMQFGSYYVRGPW